MSDPGRKPLLKILKGRRLSYYSVTAKRWIQGPAALTLADICGLNSEERDMLLGYLRARRVSEREDILPRVDMSDWLR